MQTLSQAVEAFCGQTYQLSEAELEREWNWGAYEEGVRMAHFRIMEMLRQLAATLGSQREQAGLPRSSAQRAMGQLQIAFRDLQAVLLGMDDETARQAPAPEEWNTSQAVYHMLRAQRGFFTLAAHNLRRSREDAALPAEMDEALWNAFWKDDPITELSEESPLTELIQHFGQLTQRVIGLLETVSEDELALPTLWWEGYDLPLQFRLHRYESHMRQHTIQAEKIAESLLGPAGEARRLVRLVYNALGEVEAVLIGAGDFGHHEMEAVRQEIEKISAEVRG